MKNDTGLYFFCHELIYMDLATTAMNINAFLVLITDFKDADFVTGLELILGIRSSIVASDILVVVLVV